LIRQFDKEVYFCLGQRLMRVIEAENSQSSLHLCALIYNQPCSSSHPKEIEETIAVCQNCLCACFACLGVGRLPCKPQQRPGLPAYTAQMDAGWTQFAAVVLHAAGPFLLIELGQVFLRFSLCSPLSMLRHSHPQDSCCSTSLTTLSHTGVL